MIAYGLSSIACAKNPTPNQTFAGPVRVIVIVSSFTVSSTSTRELLAPFIDVTPAPQHWSVFFVLKNALAAPVPLYIIVQPVAIESEAPWEVSTLVLPAKVARTASKHSSADSIVCSQRVILLAHAKVVGVYVELKPSFPPGNIF